MNYQVVRKIGLSQIRHGFGKCHLCCIEWSHSIEVEIENQLKSVEIVFVAPRCYSSAAAVPSYDGPSVKTAVPGPKSKALLGELNKLQVKLIEILFILESNSLRKCPRCSNVRRRRRMKSWRDVFRWGHAHCAIFWNSQYSALAALLHKPNVDQFDRPN